MMREAGGSCAEGETGNGGRCLFWKGEKREKKRETAQQCLILCNRKWTKGRKPRKWGRGKNREFKELKAGKFGPSV